MDSVRETPDWVEIRVGRSSVAKVDFCDFEIVSRYKWSKVGQEHCKYAQMQKRSQDSVHVKMHRLILDVPKGVVVDHINGDGLDNRRANLRSCSHGENLRNSRKHCKSSSAYKGVYWSKKECRWIAQLVLSGKKIYGGRFKHEEDAARRYDEMALDHFGEYAKLNFTN